MPEPPAASALPVPALVMVGGRPGPDFAAAAGVPDSPGGRALAAIAGLPMVRLVLRALQAAEAIDRVLLVAPEGFPDQPDADERVVAGGGLEENIGRGLERIPACPFFLVVTADVPFLTPEAVDDFVRRSAALDVDCCFPAIPRTACEQHFPGMRRTYIRIGREGYTAGNLVFQRSATYSRQAALLKEAYHRRKNPLFLARLIGLPNVLKFLAGRLSLDDISAAASTLLGVRCRLIETLYAEIGTDIDRPDDLRRARELMAGTRSGESNQATPAT